MIKTKPKPEKVSVSILSPVHVGSGEKYGKMDFLVRDIRENPQKIGIINFDILASVLGKDVNDLPAWIEEQRYPDIFYFLKELNKYDIKDKLFKQSLYQMPFYFREDKNNKKFFRDISVCIKDMKRRPYIPGTELKGAIRTAVLYNLLQDPDTFSYLKGLLLDFRKEYEPFLDLVMDKKDHKWNNALKPADVNNISGDYWRRLPLWLKKDMVNGYLRVATLKKELYNKMTKLKVEERLIAKALRVPGKNDAKYDCMKFVQVSDTEPFRQSDMMAAEVMVINTGPVPLCEEFIRESSSTCTFSLEDNNCKWEKLSFQDCQKKVLSREELFTMIYNFSARLLQEELVYFTDGPGKQYTQIREHLERISRANSAGSPVLRLGKDEGFFSLTIGLCVKDKDEDLYYKTIVPVTKNTSYSNPPPGFPKTRKVIDYGNDSFAPIGWIQFNREG